MKKRFNIIGLIVLSAIFITSGISCSKESATSTQSNEELQSLTVTMALSEEEWDVMRNVVIPAFEETNNVKVEAIQVEASNVKKKLVSMKEANKMEIDIIAQDVNQLSSLVYDGLVEDLSDYTSIIPEESIGKLSEAGVFDGKTYFMPYRPNAEINYYNQIMFDKYNLNPPKTWDELYDTAKTLKENEGLGRLCLKMKLNGDAIELAEFIRSAGGDLLVLNDQGSIEAFTFLQKLWPELSTNTIKAGFSSSNTFLATDEVYYCPNWPFAANIIVKDGGKEEIKAYEGFTGPKTYAKTLGGEMLGIPVGSPNKELAIKFIQYLESKEVQEIFMRENGWASFRTDTYENVDEWQVPYFESLQKALEVATPLPRVSYWSEAQQLINDAGKEILLNNADVKTTLDKYAAKMEELRK